MKRNTLKVLGLSVAAVSLFAMAQHVNAQSETVTADLITNAAVTTAVVDPMDFGTWLLVHGGVGVGTLTLLDDGSLTVNSAIGTAVGSTFALITASASDGLVNVQGPAFGAGNELTMTRSATADFADTGLSLTNVTYRTATENGAIATDGSFGDVTLTAANTDEPVTFGGEVAISGTPADQAHAATFLVSFAY